MSSIATGTEISNLAWVDTPQVVGARFLPRVLGREFTLESLDTDALALSAEQIDVLRASFDEADTLWLPAHGFSIDGYLQLEAVPSDQSAEPTWVTAGAVIGGYAYYSVLREDTSVVYAISNELADALQTLRNQFTDNVA